MRTMLRRTAAFSAAIAGVALIGTGCGHAAKSSESTTSTTTTSASASVTSATPGSAAPSTTTMTGANGAAYTIEGPILTKYESLPASAKNDLGAPTGDQQKNPDGGVYQQFAGGAIVYKNQAYVVWGKIRDKWNQVGGSQGQLGYPTSDETNTPDGTKKSTFEHGAVTYKPGDTDAVLVACVSGLDC